MPGDRFKSGISHDSQAAMRLDAKLTEAGPGKVTLEQNVNKLFEQWRGPIYQ